MLYAGNVLERQNFACAPGNKWWQVLVGAGTHSSACPGKLAFIMWLNQPSGGLKLIVVWLILVAFSSSS